MAEINYILINIVICIVYTTLYGYIRAFISIKLGDKGDDAKYRLSLRPSLHIDTVGILFMILYNVGFIKPMRNRAINFKNRKGSTIIISTLPVIILFAFSSILMFTYFNIVDIVKFPNDTFVVGYNDKLISPVGVLIVIKLVRLSLGVLIYNIIPIYPLECEKIFNYVASPNLRVFWSTYDKALQMGLVLLTVIGVIPRIINVISNYYISIFF